MSLVRTPSRRNLAILMAIMMLLGTFGILSLPAQAGHGDACLDLTPETATNPVGSTHTITAQLYTRSAVPSIPCGDRGTAAAAPGVVINFDIDGPGDSFTAEPVDRTCTTGATGSCIMQYSSTMTGTDTITGWISDGTRDEAETVDEGDAPDPTSNEPDETDVVEKTWTAPPATATRLDCSPENEVNSTGDSHTVTCTATDQFGNRVQGAKVDAEATGANDPDGGNTTPPDYTCTTNAQGQCSFTHGPSGAPSTPTNNEGTTTYRAWLDQDNSENNVDDEGDTTETPGATENDDGTDVVTKEWRHSPLNCDPETDVNPAGTSHTVTCTARGTDGQPESGVFIDVEAAGANDPDGTNSPASPDFTCTTNAQGQCSFTHGPSSTGASNTRTTNSAGTTTYRAWIDEDGNHNASPQSHGIFEGDATEGQDDGSPGSGPTPGPTPSPSSTPGSIPEPDHTDVVTKTWTASRLDCNPETDRNPTGSAHSIPCQARDQSNALVAGVEIDVEATGANDPDGSESFQTPDFTCTTASNGVCTIVHGPGGIGTTNNAGTTIYTGWIDIDRNNTTVETDTNEGRAEGTDTAEPDNTDVVEKIWVASRLDCTPESDTNPAQTAHTIVCSARDQSGFGVAGISLDAEATGPNDPDNADSPTSPDFSCTTGSDGSCSFTHGPGGRGTTAGFGRTIYRAWIDADGNDATAEADTTEGRDETAGATASPTPSGSPSPTATATSSTSGSRQAVAAGVAMQQTPTPTPTQSQTPTPTPTSSGTASPRPTASPSGTPAPTGPGQRAEPDDTDVVEKNWSAVPTRLEITPETDSAAVGSCNAFTITATDASGGPVENVVVDVEQRHERSDNQTANDEPTVSFCRPGETDGANPSDVDPTRGDLGTGSDGTLGGEADRATDAAGKVTIGIRVAPSQGSNGTGNVLVTTFYENEDNDDADTDEPQDTATKTWVPSRARTIDCTPENATNRLGTEHTVTCTVRDANGQPAQGEGVLFTEEGPGAFTTPTQRTSSAQGVVTATVTSDDPGEQTITGTLESSTQGEPDTDECDRAADDPSGSSAGTCSDSVQKSWARRPAVESGPCKNFFQGSRTDRAGGGKVIVGTSDDDELRGTPGRDLICGLGGNDRIRGAGGNDRIVGGGGRDRIQGGSGRDRIKGQAGSDRINGGPGADTIRGGRGNDTLRGGGGNDDLAGGGGDDTVDGGAGRDACSGGRGRDELSACE